MCQCLLTSRAELLALCIFGLGWVIAQTVWGRSHCADCLDLSYQIRFEFQKHIPGNALWYADATESPSRISSAVLWQCVLLKRLISTGTVCLQFECNGWCTRGTLRSIGPCPRNWLASGGRCHGTEEEVRSTSSILRVQLIPIPTSFRELSTTTHFATMNSVSSLPLQPMTVKLVLQNPMVFSMKEVHERDWGSVVVQGMTVICETTDLRHRGVRSHEWVTERLTYIHLPLPQRTSRK